MTGRVEPVGFENWQRLIREIVEPGGRVRASLGITAIYVISALVIEFVFGLSIAVLLNSGVWAGGLWQALMILPMVVPPTVAAVMFKVLENADYGALAYYLQRAGITDKVEPLLGGTGQLRLPAVLIPEIWQWTPFFVLILLAGLKSLPDRATRGVPGGRRHQLADVLEHYAANAAADDRGGRPVPPGRSPQSLRLHLRPHLGRSWHRKPRSSASTPTSGRSPPSNGATARSLGC